MYAKRFWELPSFQAGPLLIAFGNSIFVRAGGQWKTESWTAASGYGITALIAIAGAVLMMAASEEIGYAERDYQRRIRNSVKERRP